ncbi:MAG: chromosomal replication initiator protein DnaA [Phycisphaerae bacterium]
MGQSAEGNLWHEALAQIQGDTGNPGHGGVPPWLADAEVVPFPRIGDPDGRQAGKARLEIRLPDGHREADLDADLRSALEQALQRNAGHPVELAFRAAHKLRPGETTADSPERPEAAPDPGEPGGLRLNPLCAFENFVTGPCNRLAHAAALAVADLPGRAYNPLFIHASIGLGKTHLLQAICHKILEPPSRAARMMYLSCEDFVNRFIAAIEHGSVETFRRRLRHLDVLVIDDVHFLADKDRTQEEFFHTFNALYQAQKQVILSSDSPPHEIPRLEERLVSRFKWGLVVRIDQPSFETRVAIIRKKARLRGRDLPEDIVQYIAGAVDTNNRELEGAVVRVLGYAALCNQEVGLDLAKEALRDLVVTPARTITIPEVADAVLRRYSARLSDLQSRRRAQSVTLPRQICMYLARRVTNRSLEEIGAFFGGRDHTTVLHAERKIRRMVEHDAVFRGLVEVIERDILRP